LGQLAILAAVACPSANLLLDRLIHGRRPSPEDGVALAA
jgi:hypothetical protein